MFIQEGSHKIFISFNDDVSIRVEDGDGFYLIQWFEYMPNSEYPHLLDSQVVTSGVQLSYKRRWYGKHRIDIHRWESEDGIVPLYSHTYDDLGKNVFFRIDNENLEATKEWLEEVRNYVSRSGCIPHISTNFNTELNITETSEETEYYSSYYIGRYFQETNGDVEQAWNEIRYGLFRKYWSHHNPRNWEKVEHRQIARDILGLTEWEDGIFFTIDGMKKVNPKIIE